jgi:hypothetical protein
MSNFESLIREIFHAIMNWLLTPSFETECAVTCKCEHGKYALVSKRWYSFWQYRELDLILPKRMNEIHTHTQSFDHTYM